MADSKHATPTEVRQATPQKANYRVLTRSLLIAAIVAAIFFVLFYMQSPV